MSEHGFLQPNPVLFDLENRKKKSGLAHELGAGADCLKCGTGCSGFQLHFWRKVCLNCRCGKVEHAVLEDEDHGAHFVGKIFDRPLRTHAEECKFIYGEEGGTREVTLDWAPPGVPNVLVNKYLRSLPLGHLSIQGSEGAQRRLVQLERQFPLHDVEPEQCHQLTKGEIDSMSSYVDNVKKNVAGQGIVEELATPTQDRQGRQDTPSPPPPPPPMELLETDPLSYTMAGTHLDLHPPILPSMGTYYAQPYQGGRPPQLKDLSQQPCHQQHQQPKRHQQHQQHQKPQECQQNQQPHQLPQEHKSQDPQQPHHHRRGSTGSSPASSPSPSPCSPMPSTPQQVKSRTRCWSCSGCSEAMLPGSVAVFAERAGRDRCWHPNCFRCSTCGDRLEDLLYFYSKGQLFCGRDFAQLMNIPRCNACDELIFSNEYTGAEGGTWHLKHFCCWVCDAPLAGHKYIAEAGQPHCLPCWQQHHGKVCSTCGQVIDPQGQRVSLGEQHWHASQACFRCGICDRSLLGGKMSYRGNTLLCSSECGQQLATRKQQESSTLPSPSGHSTSPVPPSSRSSPVPGPVTGLTRLGVQTSKDSLPPHQRIGAKDGLSSKRQGLRDPPRPASASSGDSVRSQHSRQGSGDSSRSHRTRQDSGDSGLSGSYSTIV